MIHKINESLAKYTTIKIGGLASNFYIPETETELLGLVKELDNYKVIGGGSNILINDEKMFDNIILMKKFNSKIDITDEGDIVVGASISLQKLINTINENGFGGIEYLYSVPGCLGGAIYMNAGRGRTFQQCISDYLISVKVFHEGRIKILKKEECKFKYRDSIFKKGEYIILEVKFHFLKKSIEESGKEKENRIKMCKEKQDASKPNFGTFFCLCNNKIMYVLSRLSYGNKKGCHMSNKTVNWVVNEGCGTYGEAIKMIKKVKLIHRLFRRQCKVEVEIWE